jgi:hypothetical protein
VASAGSSLQLQARGSAGRGYENLLKSRRQVLHRRIAETLRDRFQTMAEIQPEVVAHHFTHQERRDQFRARVRALWGLSGW